MLYEDGTCCCPRGCFNLSLRVKLCQRLSTFYATEVVAPSAACGVLPECALSERMKLSCTSHTCPAFSLALCLSLFLSASSPLSAIDCGSCSCKDKVPATKAVEKFLNLNVKFTEPEYQTHSVTSLPSRLALALLETRPPSRRRKTLMWQLLQSRPLRFAAHWPATQPAFLLKLMLTFSKLSRLISFLRSIVLH